MIRLSFGSSQAEEARVKKKALFVGLFLALALSVSAVGSAEPAPSQGVVKLWAFYDKDVNAYPTGWQYLHPVITDPMDWQQDSPWLPFPSPHHIPERGKTSAMPG